MLKNRFFKTRLGFLADLAIVKGIDNTDNTTGVATAALVSYALTIGASPTIGDSVTITIDGVDYIYAVPAGGATTQQVHDGIAQLLQTNTQGFQLYSHTGTTSSVFVLIADATWNGKTVTSSETGTTFTIPGATTFAGTAADGGAPDTLDAFRASTTNKGLIWAYWVDTNKAVEAGDTRKPANANREFVYVWKQEDGTLYRSTPIKVKGYSVDKVLGNAGTALVRQIAFGGTISVGQWIHVRVRDTTATQLPYPNAVFSAKVKTNINAALTEIAAKINAEKGDLGVSAAASTTNLNLTSKDPIRSFECQAFVETTVAQPADASAITQSVTTPAVYPIGRVSDVQELQDLFVTNNGGVIYTPVTYTKEQLGLPASNVDATGATPYGFVLVTTDRVEKGGVMQPNLAHRAYVLVCLPSSQVAALAGL